MGVGWGGGGWGGVGVGWGGGGERGFLNSRRKPDTGILVYSKPIQLCISWNVLFIVIANSCSLFPFIETYYVDDLRLLADRTK